MSIYSEKTVKGKNAPRGKISVS